MSKIEKFEDLKCWQAARMLVKDVYLLSNKGPLGKDFDTKNQIRRAALSAMNNIAEGFGRFGKKDFVRFLNVSQSSVQEVKACYMFWRIWNIYRKKIWCYSVQSPLKQKI